MVDLVEGGRQIDHRVVLRCQYLYSYVSSGDAKTSRQPGHFQLIKVVRQVIRCKRQRSKPGRFEVRKTSSQVTGCTFFSSKKLTTLFSRRPRNVSRRQRRWLFHCQNKTNKAVRYSNIFISCSHYYWSKAIGNRQGGARGGGSSSQVIWPGTLWCSAATVCQSCDCEGTRQLSVEWYRGSRRSNVTAATRCRQSLRHMWTNQLFSGNKIIFWADDVSAPFHAPPH